jgi:hypothetical protein
MKEEFMKYFQRQSELKKQDFINLIDGSAKCAVLRGHLYEDEMKQMLL